MRIWDIPPSKLCNKHLVAQHHEIHCIACALFKPSNKWYKHAETKRWRDYLYTTTSLKSKHDETVAEMLRRGIKHHEENDKAKLHGWPNMLFTPVYPAPWQPIEKQIEILKSKGCPCYKNITGG